MKTRITSFWLLVFFLFFAFLARSQNSQVEFAYGVRGYSENQLFSNPQGIFYDRWNKEVYICDSGNHQVAVFDSNGFPLYRFNHWLKINRKEEKILGEPRNLVVNKAGNIFLIDNLAGFIDILEQRGNSVDKLSLQEIPEFENVRIRPEFLAIDTMDNLYVATSGALISS